MRYSVEYLNILQTVTVLNLFNDKDHLNLIGKIPGKIMEKQSPVRITFSRETGQPMSTTWRRGKHGDMAFFNMMVRGGFFFTYLMRIS